MTITIRAVYVEDLEWPFHGPGPIYRYGQSERTAPVDPFPCYPLVQTAIEQDRGLKYNELLDDYAKIRELEPGTAHGGTWHRSLGEVFACDFRIHVAGIETDYWPHPGIDRDVPAVRDWWREALASK